MKKITWSIYNYSKETPKEVVAICASIKGVLAIFAGSALVQSSPYWALGFALTMGIIDEVSKGFGYKEI